MLDRFPRLSLADSSLSLLRAALAGLLTPSCTCWATKLPGLAFEALTEQPMGKEMRTALTAAREVCLRRNT